MMNLEMLTVHDAHRPRKRQSSLHSYLAKAHCQRGTLSAEQPVFLCYFKTISHSAAPARS